MIYVYLEKGNIGIRNENMRDEEQTVRIRTQCCLSLTIRSPSVKPNVMHCFIFHFFWVQLGKHDNRVHCVVNKFYLYDRTSHDFIVPPKASTNPHHCSHPSSLQHDCVWTKTNHQTRLLNFSVQPKELQNHCFVFVFDKKKKKKWEIVCVRLVCTHTMTRSRSCVRASISQGPACLSHKGLFKKKQWQRDNTAAQTKSTFFPPLSFFVFFVLIECAAPNNATFPSTISLCREPAPFFLISLHLNRKEPR